MEHNFFFQLLKNIMSNAFQTETFYLKPTHDSIPNIPAEIFKTIFPNNLYADERIFPSKNTPNRRLFLIKSSLSFYSIHFYLNLEENTDIIFIGPFRSNSFSIDDFIKELEQIPSLATNYSLFLNYYESLPCVSLENIMNTVSYLINTYMLLPEAISPIYVDYTTINNGLFDTENSTDTAAIQKQVEKAHERLISLLQTITSGNLALIHQEINLFLSSTGLLAKRSFSQCQNYLLAINAAIATSVLFTHIQPYDSSNLYLIFVDKINHAQTHDALLKIIYDMCYTYCSLFHNNSFPEYSKTISDVINYIYVHLAEPLSLSVIAEYFNRNESRLSADFKEETGKTLTNFIQQTRISRAANYLSNTELSVSEIALAVGFDDFAYFSRIFKKHTGYSPKEYRDMHNSSDFKEYFIETAKKS